MKDAFGGSILFYIILAFIVVFIIFIAMIMNYARAYRTNNYVVTMIEQYEGKVKYDYLKANLVENHNYYGPFNVSCNDIDGRGAVLHVTTYINFELPIIDFDIDIPINNDTKTIYQVFCDDMTSCNSNSCKK